MNGYIGKRSKKNVSGTMAYKILYLQSTSEIGGSDIILLRIVQALDPSRFEPHIVLHREGPFGDAYRQAGCRVHILQSMRKLTSRKGLSYFVPYLVGYPLCVLQIARLARKEGIDLIHTNTLHNLYGFLAAKLAGIPHIWHVREIVVQSALLRWIEVRLAMRFSARVIVMSNAIAEPFQRRGGGFLPTVVKLYEGVDLNLFHPCVSGQRIRKELALPDTSPLVGTICRLDPWKGVDVFLKAASLVHLKMPHVHFLICGGEIEGHLGYEARLRRQASSLGLDGVVHFAGWRYQPRDIPEVYGALNVSVQCPVHPEPFGLYAVEAMASGVPLVAVNQGGPPELCANGKTSLLVPPRDPEKTAEAVLTLLQEPARAQAMGEAGRQRAEDLFDVRKCIRQLQDLYDEILQGPSRAC